MIKANDALVAWMLFVCLVFAPGPSWADELLSQSLPSGGIADIRAIDGSIRVIQGGAAVTVSAHVSTVSGSPIDLHVVEKREGAVWMVCTVPLTQLSCANQGHEGIRADGDTRIDLTVTLPPGVKLSLDDVSGSIDVRNVRNDVDVHSVSGGVSIAATGVLSARTETGDVFVQLGQGCRTVTIDSITGNVALRMPRAANGRIEARTISGNIIAKDGIQLSENTELVGRDEHATLGLEGPAITIHTIGGSITIDRW